MPDEKIQKILKSIGFAENEIKIYLDLIKNDSSSALDISNRTKIYRTNVYDALKSLVEKGFATESVSEKKKVFQGVSPEKIKDYIVQKEQEIEAILPDLLELSKKTEDKESFSIAKGVFSMRNTLYELLKLKKPINVYGIPKDLTDIFGKPFLDEFHKKRMKEKVVMRHIYNQEAKERIAELKKMKYTEARHLSKKYDAETPTNVCGDTVVFFILSDPVTVIRIKSQKIADTYNKYFEILWNNAK